MIYYPVFLDLRGKSVLVAGAGPVAVRKVRGLLEAGARVTVVAPEGDAAMDSLPVHRRRRRFRVSDLAGCVLAFAATNDRTVNRRIGEEAARRGVWANIADSRDECAFLTPARLRHGEVTVAVSTGGKDPRLARDLRDRIARALED